MSNSIALAANYLPILDEIYKRESLTSVLDTANERIQFINADTIKLFKTAMDGLGNYSRNSGYVSGDVTGSWETLQLQYDRGRAFQVDAMDDEETINMAFGTLLGEFLRTKVVPEIDAIRFAAYAGKSGISAATPADIGSISDALTAIDAAEQTLGDDEVPVEGRVMFVSEAFYSLIKGKVTRYLANETSVQRNVVMLDDMPIIRVPQVRFNTAIRLLDGTTGGQTGGGYSNVPASGYSYKINFMIVHPSAVAQVVKHNPARIISPEVNQSADAYKLLYRVYHGCWVEDNKVKGIYLHRGTTANS